MRVTELQYYKGFISLRGAFAALPFVQTVLRAFVGDSNSLAAFLYPPLGDAQALTLAATILFLLMATYVIFVFCRGARKTRPGAPTTLILVIGAVFGVWAWIVLYTHFIRRVPIPAVGTDVLVSIGYQRTDFALKSYPQWSDDKMLHDAGPWEQSIRQLWTLKSICVVRVLLWTSYTLTLCCFLSFVCFAVYSHAAEQTSSGSNN